MTNSAAETAGQKLAIDLCDAWCKSKAAPYEKSISIDEMGAFMDGVEAAVTALRAAAGDKESGVNELPCPTCGWTGYGPKPTVTPPDPAEAGGDAVRIIKEEWQGYCSRAKECDAHPDAGAKDLIDRLLARFATPTPAAFPSRDCRDRDHCLHQGECMYFDCSGHTPTPAADAVRAQTSASLANQTLDERERAEWFKKELAAANSKISEMEAALRGAVPLMFNSPEREAAIRSLSPATGETIK